MHGSDLDLSFSSCDRASLDSMRYSLRRYLRKLVHTLPKYQPTMLFLICVFWASMFFLALYEFTKEVYWCLLMYVPVICAFALFFMYADYPQANVSNAMKVVSLKVAIKRINRRKKLFALLDKEADDTIKDDILMELSAKPMGEDDLLMRLNTSNEFKELNIKESNRI